jgi:ATP-dependent Clp endopeptidase proteolytic subunit ClpP
MNRVEMVRRLKAVAGRPEAAGRPWYRITAEAEGPARVDVYDEIGGSWFSDGVSASDFVASLAAIPSARGLEVHINSPGGDVFDGIAIYNAIAQFPGRTKTVVDGLAASAASFIAQAGQEREVSPGSMVMIHDASGLCIGNAADMRILAGLLDQVSGNLADIYAAHAGKTSAEWRDAMQAETWYKAADAVSAGLADRLAERPAPEGAAAGFDLSVFAKAPVWLTAAAAHDPFTGKHAHAHTAAGSQGDDGTHSHQHSHDNDADHGHGHSLADDPPEPGGTQDAALTADGVRAIIREEIRAAAAAGGTGAPDAGAGNDGTSDHADMPAWLRDDA